MACTMTLKSPDSSPFRHVVLNDSQAKHAPASSPLSAARRISAVPLYPSIDPDRQAERGLRSPGVIPSPSSRADPTELDRLLRRKPFFHRSDPARLTDRANVEI